MGKSNNRKHYIELAIGLFGVALSGTEGIATSITDATLGGVAWVLPGFMARGAYAVLGWLVVISPYFRFICSMLLLVASIGLVIWAIAGIIKNKKRDRNADKSGITVKEFHAQLETLVIALDKTAQTIKATAEQIIDKEKEDVSKE